MLIEYWGVGREEERNKFWNYYAKFEAILNLLSAALRLKAGNYNCCLVMCTVLKYIFKNTTYNLLSNYKTIQFSTDPDVSIILISKLSGCQNNRQLYGIWEQQAWIPHGLYFCMIISYFTTLFVISATATCQRKNWASKLLPIIHWILINFFEVSEGSLIWRKVLRPISFLRFPLNNNINFKKKVKPFTWQPPQA